MKTPIITFSLLFFFGMSVISCKKICEFKKPCTPETCEVCVDTDYQDHKTVAANVKQYIVKPLVIDPSCNCIVQGFVKYVKDGKTIALVDYGDGTCDKWAVKTICYNGKCEDKLATSCKFELDCTETGF